MKSTAGLLAGLLFAGIVTKVMAQESSTGVDTNRWIVFTATPGAEKDVTNTNGIYRFGGGEAGRAYLAKQASNFAATSFVAEVTAIVNGGGGAGCAFFGLGLGEADPQNYYEPSRQPAVFVRLAPGDFAGGQVMASVNGKEAGQASASVGDGTHRVKMIWDAAGKRALFDIDGKSSVTVAARDVDFGDAAHLFFGGASGVKFSGFIVKPLSDQEIKTAGFGENFSGNPTARTWLPLIPAAKDGMRPLACWYDGSKLAASRAFTNGALQTASTRWACDVKEQPVAGEPDARDLTATFTLAEGAAKSAGVAVAFDFAGWSTNNYVLIPASVYNGNRNRIEQRAYATGLNREDIYKKDLPLTTCDLPQLAPELGQPSKIEVSACNAATPAICFFSPEKRRGIIMLAEQGIPKKNDANGTILDNGFSVEESADRTHATLVVSSPGVRERKPEFIGFSASPDRGMDWQPGDTVTLHLRVYSFAAADIPGLLEKFMTVRKDVTGPNHPRDLIPFSEVIRLMTGRIDSRFYQGQDNQFYCPENAAWISFGWIGGLMDTFPMLALNDELHLERVTKTFDFAIPRGQGQSGYFYGALNHDGKVFGREGYDEHPEFVLTRKNADVLFWMVKQFMLLKKQGRASAIKPAWEQNIKRLADAFVATWKKDGQWGNFLNNQTGEVAVYNSSSGVVAAGGLALAADYFKNPEYLVVAKQAAKFYYSRDFVKLGMTTGHSADTLQNADSDSPAGLMNSLMTLYELTGDARWLEKSRNLANLLATWTVSYDYLLPTNTELARLGAKLAGVVWASTQNKHGAPGNCTSSGDALFKIYRATGDRRYAELMRDIIHAHAEGIRPDGKITERLTYCDADSRGSRGSPYDSTGWCELNGILMAMEIPGIYLRTDTGELFVFDSVKAEVVKRDGDGVTLKVTNPTQYPARVSIFAEGSAVARQPLGCTAFIMWPKVDVMAGETKTVQIAPDGRLQPANGA
jgi:hypothetical protein